MLRTLKVNTLNMKSSELSLLDPAIVKRKDSDKFEAKIITEGQCWWHKFC